MSVLETPRIAFRGKITWDPIVTNNYASFYVEDDCEASLQPPGTAEAFRRSAIQSVASNFGNWNPDGTHRSVFYETTIKSVDLGDGPTTDDAFVGVPVSFRGMLVDSEPYGGVTSQLFFDSMSFGIAGGCRVLAPRRTRMTARRIYFARNSGYRYIAGGASVMWQTTFDKAALQLAAHDSKALQALQALLERDDVLGLTVRWNAYRTVYFDEPNMADPSVGPGEYDALRAKLEGGGWQPNPARSELVGVLGLWRHGEPEAVGGDRFLVSAQSNDPIASAYARLERDRIVLDLQNSIPETDFQLTKKDFGALSVIARDPSGQQPDRALATMDYCDYDRDAYDLGGGIVTLDVDPADAWVAARWDLILQGADGTDYLVESPLYACPDSPNTYIDEGDQAQIPVRILERGAPPSAPIALQITPMSGNSASTVTSDASGLAHVPVVGGQGDVQGFLLTAGPGPAPSEGSFDPVRDPYIYVRTWPADAQIASLEPTWQNVYQNVLINWHAMAPCMDNWLKLGDEAQVAASADAVRALTDPDYFEGFYFMPVTRDLTPGMRTLLYNWLDKVAPRDRAAPLAESAPASAPAPASTVHERIRDLRRG